MLTSIPIRTLGVCAPSLVLAQFLSSPIVAAQGRSADAAAPASAPVLEEVLVTGSLVRRSDYVSPSPLFTIERDTLLRNGTPTLSEYLNRTPQFTPAFDGTSSNPGSGRGEVNLRGLGSNRSLVLLDGQRLGPAGSDGAVDINVLPTALIENIEVLTGGASSVYGSDAMAGAVNIQLRRDVEGIEIGGGYAATERGDANTWDLSVAGGFGFAEGRGSVSGFVARSDREAVSSSARAYSRVPIVEDFVTGELQEGGSPSTPAGWIPIPAVIDGQFGADGITFTPDGFARLRDPSADSYNFAGFNYVQMPLERDTAAVFGEYEIGAGVTVTLDLLWAQVENRVEIAPLPAFTFASINLDNPFLTAQARDVLSANYDPAGTGLISVPFSTRLESVGPRFRQDERETRRIALGLNGGFGERFGDWSWEIAYISTENTIDGVIGNNVLRTRLQQSFLVDPATGDCIDADPGCVGADWYGPGRVSLEAANALRGPNLQESGRAEQEVLQMLTRGSLMAPGDRRVSLALGFEYREDSSRYQADPRAGDGEILGGFSQDSIAGEFDVAEAFVEAVIPIVSDQPVVGDITLDVGARYSDYSTAGDAPSWKVGANWEPVGGLRFRAMAQRAVRAPNVGELFEQLVTDVRVPFFPVPDPCSASEDPLGNGVGDLCIAQGLSPEQVGLFEANPFYPREVIRGGNVDLEAEEADTLTLGFTWLPEMLPGFSLALDYYSIEIDNAIVPFGELELTPNCFATNDPNSDVCRNIGRDESGNLAFFREGPLNAAALTAKGIDLQVDYLWQLPAIAGRSADVRIGFIGNHAMELGFQSDPLAGFVDCAGSFGAPCNQTSTGSNPDFRTTTTLAFTWGSLTTEVVWRWIAGMQNANRLANDGLEAFPLLPETGDEHYGDINVTWRPRASIDVFAGITNVGDNQPPILGFNDQQNNTNPNLYDALGRRFHGSVRVRF